MAEMPSIESFGSLLAGSSEHLAELIMSDQIDQMLKLKTWAIVGLSNNAERAAYGVAKVLIEKQFGEEAYPKRILMADLPEESSLIPNPINNIPGFLINQHYPI